MIGTMRKRDKGEEDGVTSRRSSRTVRLLALMDPIGRWEQKILSYPSITRFDLIFDKVSSLTYIYLQILTSIHRCSSGTEDVPSASRSHFQARDDGIIPPSHVTICTS
jgi:hypothetical protein